MSRANSHSHAQQHVANEIGKLAEFGLANPKEMSGPTPTSNWIIKDLILCGDYPRAAKLGKLIAAGVEHFVDLRGPPHAENYLLGTVLQSEDGQDEDSELQYTNFDLQAHINSVQQSAIAETALMLRGVIADCLLKQRIAYLHCQDGHTLTAVAMCGILSYVYGVSGMKASAIAAQLHGSRQENENIHQLLVTPSQKAFVRDLSADTGSFPIGLFSGSVQSSLTNSISSRGNSPTQAAPPATSGSFNQQGGKSQLSSQSSFSGGGSGAAPPSMHPGNFEGYSQSNPSSQPGSAANSPQRDLQGRAIGAPGSQQKPPSPGNMYAQMSRFEHTKGHGGGLTSINLFGGDQQPATPPKRTGRAAVPGMTPDFHHRIPSNSQLNANYVDPMAEALHAHQRTGSFKSQGQTPDREAASQAKSGQVSPHEYTDSAPSSSSVRKDSIHNHSVQQPTPAPVTHSNQDHLLPIASNGQSPLIPRYVLPPLIEPKTEADIARGPTLQTNWVVRDQVLCGPLPQPTQKEFRFLVQQRFDTFVSLTEVDETSSYLHTYTQRSQHPAVAIHYPMFDGSVLQPAEYERFYNFISDIVERIMVGEKVYIHCRGGHGRTGVVVTAILSILYKIPGMRAVNLCDSLHECRVDTGGVRSPEQSQRTGILAFLNNLPQ